MSITVCIGNYGYYNEGELHDAWIELPKTDEEIRDFLKENRLYDAMHEEIYISDYDGVPFGLSGLFGEVTSLDDLNLLAMVMDDMPDAVETVQRAIDCGIDNPDSVLGLMNWIVQADEIPFYTYDYDGAYAKDQWGQTGIERCSAEENYGYTILEGTPLMQMLESDSEAMCAFDVGRYGKICAENGYAVLGDEGYVDAMQDMPRENMYTREEIEEMVGIVRDDDDPTDERGYAHEEDGIDLDAEMNEAREVSHDIQTLDHDTLAHEAAR